MARRISLGGDIIPMDLWPSATPEGLSNNDKERFEQHQEAMRQYFDGGRPTLLPSIRRAL